MIQAFDVDALIRLQAQACAISDALRVQAAGYLNTLPQLIRPRRRTQGLNRALKGLRFPVTFERLKARCNPALCLVGSPVSASLPNESVIRSGTQGAGSHGFEQLVVRESVAGIEAAIRQRPLLTFDGL